MSLGKPLRRCASNNRNCKTSPGGKVGPVMTREIHADEENIARLRSEIITGLRVRRVYPLSLILHMLRKYIVIFIDQGPSDAQLRGTSGGYQSYLRMR